GIPPNEILTGKPIPDHEILALGNRSSAELSADYFTNVTGLPPEIGTLILQMQTAAWAKVGHARYAKVNYALAAGVAIVLGIWAYASNRTLPEAVTQIFAPAAPFVVGRLQLARRHRDQAATRADI